METPILSLPANRATPAKLRILIETYAATGRLNRACEIAGITRMTHYRKLQTDPAYKQAFEEAEQQVGQELEDLAVDRAYDGDNHVLLALLKRFRPEHYRERVSMDTTITVNLVDRMTAANERLLTLRRSNAGEPDES